jgi:hypothetical protein
MCGFCNVWVCVCMGFVMCGCFDNCVGVLLISVLVFTVFLYSSLYVYLFLFFTSVRTTAPSENLIAINNNNNDNNNNNKNLCIPNFSLLTYQI